MTRGSEDLKSTAELGEIRQQIHTLIGYIDGPELSTLIFVSWIIVSLQMKLPRCTTNWEWLYQISCGGNACQYLCSHANNTMLPCLLMRLSSSRCIDDQHRSWRSDWSGSLSSTSSIGEIEGRATWHSLEPLKLPVNPASSDRPSHHRDWSKAQVVYTRDKRKNEIYPTNGHDCHNCPRSLVPSLLQRTTSRLTP